MIALPFVIYKLPNIMWGAAAATAYYSFLFVMMVSEQNKFGNLPLNVFRSHNLE